MARPREFDRDDALNKAMAVFWEKGYAATSTADLLAAMQIGRQSLYDTFGDKHALYLAALQRYNETSIGELVSSLQSAGSLAGIANMLQTFAARPEADNAKGCMGVNAVCEFGDTDPAVAAVQLASSAALNHALANNLQAAIATGEVSPSTSIPQAVAYIVATLSGMKISAKAGSNAATLKAIADLAIAALRTA